MTSCFVTECSLTVTLEHADKAAALGPRRPPLPSSIAMSPPQPRLNRLDEPYVSPRVSDRRHPTDDHRNATGLSVRGEGQWCRAARDLRTQHVTYDADIMKQGRTYMSSQSQYSVSLRDAPTALAPKAPPPPAAVARPCGQRHPPRIDPANRADHRHRPWRREHVHPPGPAIPSRSIALAITVDRHRIAGPPAQRTSDKGRPGVCWSVRWHASRFVTRPASNSRQGRCISAKETRGRHKPAATDRRSHRTTHA